PKFLGLAAAVDVDQLAAVVREEFAGYDLWAVKAALQIEYARAAALRLQLGLPVGSGRPGKDDGLLLSAPEQAILRRLAGGKVIEGKKLPAGTEYSYQYLRKYYAPMYRRGLLLSTRKGLQATPLGESLARRL